MAIDKTVGSVAVVGGGGKGGCISAGREGDKSKCMQTKFN